SSLAASSVTAGSVAGRGLPGIQRSTTNPPASASTAAISVVMRIECTNASLAGPSRDRPDVPSRCATAWVAVIEEDAALRAAAGRPARVGLSELRENWARIGPGRGTAEGHWTWGGG